LQKLTRDFISKEKINIKSKKKKTAVALIMWDSLLVYKCFYDNNGISLSLVFLVITLLSLVFLGATTGTLH